MLDFLRTRFALWMGLLAAAAPLGAQEAIDLGAIDSELASYELQLELTEAELASTQANEALLEAMQPRLDRIVRDARALAERLRARAKAVQALIDALGPAPAEGQPAEAGDIADKRAKLETRLADLEGRARQADLERARTEQAVARILALRQVRLAETLLERSPPPLSGQVLAKVPAHLLSVVAQLVEAPAEKWAPALVEEPAGRGAAWVLPILLVGGALLAWWLRGWLMRRASVETDERRPSFARRLILAVAVGVGHAVVPAAVAAVPLLWFEWVLDIRLGILGDAVFAAAAAIAAVLLVSGLSRAVLAPALGARWRLTRLTDESATALHRRIVKLSVLAAVVLAVRHPAAAHLDVPLELGVFYDAVGDSLVAVLILSLLPAGLWRTRPPTPVTDERETPTESLGRGHGVGTGLRALVAAAAVSVPIAAVAGYVNLANYLVRGLLETAALAGLVYVAHGLVRDASYLLMSKERGPLTGFWSRLGFARSDTRRLRFWLLLIFEALLAMTAGMAFLHSWGVPRSLIESWLTTLFTGIEIGTLTLSVTDVLVALGLFVVVIAITRLLQRVLEERIFPETRFDIGVRNSLKTAFGYVGLVVAAALAIAALGLDLSNIALIAGALSVGIGFGLQNIVNNFVSGLILLVERPLKVGDWVVVGEHQGHVQRINVRATEIQKFNRSTVIIPNSELISSSVVNWTHRDLHARVDVAVGVAYGSDPERVREVLLGCLDEQEGVLDDPEPFVLFVGFGDSALDFELRYFVNDAADVIRSSSRMRFEIHRALEAAEIAIPFPQRDLHLPDLDRLRDALGRRDEGAT